MSYRVGLIIVSDRAFSGEREDECMPLCRDLLAGDRYEIVAETIVSDDPTMIAECLSEYIDEDIDLIITSGGTGCAERDNTPEVVAQVIEKFTPGVDEAIRAFSRSKAPFAIYSRSVSGVAQNSFIVTLPGSPKAVREILEFLLPTLHHPLGLVAGSIHDCQAELPE